MNNKKLLLLVAIACAVAAFFIFDLGQFFSLDYLKSKQASIEAYRVDNPIRAALVYVGLYIGLTSLSLPAAGIMTLAGGAIFGLLIGGALVVVSSACGATIAFTVSRFILRDMVQSRFGDSLKAINEGIERDGAFYLLTLRLVPVFPFFVINLVMALTPIKVLTFALVSLVGMVPATLVFVNAGTQLAQIESVGGILSPGLIGSFTLLGIFPLLANWLVQRMKAYRVLRPFEKPTHFDRNVVVIGAGAAGLVSAYIAAMAKAKVSLIESGAMGGDCLNTGCVPSKALLRSAKFLAQIKRSKEFGIRSASAEFDFAEVMERVQNVIRDVAPHDSVERYSALGVDCINGKARITSPYSVEVDGRTLTTRSIIVATGGSPFVPPIEGIEKTGFLTSDTVWQLRELPKRLVVLGGGPIGSELSQAFARLGSQVSQVEMLPRILIREDPEIAALVGEQFKIDGVDVLTAHQARRCELVDGQKVLVCDHDGEEVRLEFDELLVAVGRKAVTDSCGLNELGIGTTPAGTVTVNEYMQTKFPNIFACGDVAGPFQFTHVAAHQAWYATVNALLGGVWRVHVDYSVIPWATFTDPEVARVGLNEQEAKEQDIPYEVTTFPLADLDRAIAESETTGVVKVLTRPGKDRILGATIVGEHAGDLIAEFVTAMRNGLGLNKVLGTIHIYPTLAEANKFAAGDWKRAHTSARALRWIERYLSWQRS